MIPDPNAAASAVASLADPGALGLAVTGFAALTTALQPITWAGDFDIAVPINGAMAMIIFIASATSFSYAAAEAARPRPPRVGAAGYLLRFVAVLYALIVIPLGVQDMGSANMVRAARPRPTGRPPDAPPRLTSAPPPHEPAVQQPADARRHEPLVPADQPAPGGLPRHRRVPPGHDAHGRGLRRRVRRAERTHAP